MIIFLRTFLIFIYTFTIIVIILNLEKSSSDNKIFNDAKDIAIVLSHGIKQITSKELKIFNIQATECTWYTKC